MKVHLYQLTKAEAFLLSRKALSELGFSIQLADQNRGVIAGHKPAKSEGDVLFFDILFSNHMPFATINLISSIFSGANGTFADEVDEGKTFLEFLEELIKKTPPNSSSKQWEEIITVANYSDFLITIKTIIRIFDFVERTLVCFMRNIYENIRMITLIIRISFNGLRFINSFMRMNN